MKKIAYMSNGVIVTSTLLDDTVKIDFNYVDITNVDIDYIDACYIEDGQIKIDQQKLIEFNRKNMPDLSRVEFKYKLHKAGKLEEVEQFIKTTDNFLLQLAYNEAQFFSRTDPLLSQALEDLGWTEAQVDEIWTS